MLILSLLLLTSTEGIIGGGIQGRYRLGEPWNAIYDLSSYVLSEISSQIDYYCVEDVRSSTNSMHNYSYCFNIAAPVLDYPKSSTWNSTQDFCRQLNTGYCSDVNLTNAKCNVNQTTSITNKVDAYQLKHNPSDDSSASDNCWHLSNGIDKNADYLDKNDPTAGIYIEYTNGDYSDNCANGNRGLRIEFKCANKRLQIPRMEQVTESPTCIYTIVLESIYGCPVECGNGCSEVCNAQGICGYDFSKKQPSCFCYDGFDGTDCDEKDTTSVSASKKIPPEQDYQVTFTEQLYTTDISGDEQLINMDIIYSIEPFQLTTQYILSDTRINSSYKYYFNIGKTINNIPKSCQNNVNPPCLDTDRNICNNIYNNSIFKGNGYVYQHNEFNDKCYLLGTSMKYSLYDDDEDYTRGFILSYTDGGYAPGCSTETGNREFAIKFVCPDTDRSYSWNKVYDSDNEVEIKTSVYESENTKCKYEITIENSLACPYQCITPVNNKQFSICGGRGKCAADPYASFVRCICEDGYTGDDCLSIEIKTTEAPLVMTLVKKNYGFLVVAIIVIILAIICIVIGWKYHRKTVDDMKNDYIRKKDNDGGLLDNDGIQKKGNTDMELISTNIDDEHDEDDTLK